MNSHLESGIVADMSLFSPISKLTGLSLIISFIDLHLLFWFLNIKTNVYEEMFKAGENVDYIKILEKRQKYRIYTLEKRQKLCIFVLEKWKNKDVALC